MSGFFAVPGTVFLISISIVCLCSLVVEFVGIIFYDFTEEICKSQGEQETESMGTKLQFGENVFAGKKVSQNTALFLRICWGIKQ